MEERWSSKLTPGDRGVNADSAPGRHIKNLTPLKRVRAWEIGRDERHIAVKILRPGESDGRLPTQTAQRVIPLRRWKYLIFARIRAAARAVRLVTKKCQAADSFFSWAARRDTLRDPVFL